MIGGGNIVGAICRDEIKDKYLLFRLAKHHILPDQYYP